MSIKVNQFYNFYLIPFRRPRRRSSSSSSLTGCHFIYHKHPYKSRTRVNPRRVWQPSRLVTVNKMTNQVEWKERKSGHDFIAELISPSFTEQGRQIVISEGGNWNLTIG